MPRLSARLSFCPMISVGSALVHAGIGTRYSTPFSLNRPPAAAAPLVVTLATDNTDHSATDNTDNTDLLLATDNTENTDLDPPGFDLANNSVVFRVLRG